MPGVKGVTTSPGLSYMFMGCKCEMPLVHHHHHPSVLNRSATITFHFSAVSFVSLVRLWTFNQYLPGDLKGQFVTVQIAVCMCGAGI